MPAVIPFIPLIAAAVGGGAAVVGSKLSANAQGRATDKAIGLQREQESEQRREFDLQEAARKAEADRQIKFMQFQWQAAAPMRAARNAVLAKYGIQASDPQMPDFSSMASGVAPGAPPPGATIPGRSGGGMGRLALGAGLGAAGAGIAAALASRHSAPSAFGVPSAGSVPGQGGVGYQMSPLTGGGIGGGVPEAALAFDPSSLSHWADYQGYGYPGDASGAYSD